MFSCEVKTMLLGILSEEYSDTNDYEAKFIETYEKDLNTWRINTQKICDKFSKFVAFEKNRKNLLWHQEAHLTYCRHGKAATTMWLRTLFEFSNITFINEKDAHRRSETIFSPPKDLNDLRGTVMITVVRHPFTRLMSFYLDKMKENYRMMKDWIKKYRNRMRNFDKWKTLVDITELDISSVPTPYEFLMYVIEENENCSFSEDRFQCFSKIDPQWRPYFVRCSPCVYDFDVIVKVETMKDDIRYISHKISKVFSESNKEREKLNSVNLKSASRNSEEWILKVLNNSIERPKDHSSKLKISTKEFTRRVFELLSREEKDRLHDAYFFDFLLFNYDSYEYD
ncbi:UNVERIFIED_CONTAM: hypothetical protein RMT77_012669 [Armadillidium vulgare]